MNKLLLVALFAFICTVNCTVTNCATYTDDDKITCSECSDGYGLLIATSRLLAAGDTTCVKCEIAKCIDCDASEPTTDCHWCDDGYGVKSGTTDSCAACKDTNCGICTVDYETCLDCSEGYAFDDDGACTACSNGCKSCDGVDDSCSACATGQVLNKTDTTNQFCCPANCAECTTAAFCTSCNDGYNLNAEKGTCFGFKTGASLTLGAIISVALFSLLF